MEGLLHAVLNEGLVHQREHFLGLRFGGGQKAGAEPGGREYGFAYFGGHHSTVCGKAGAGAIDSCSGRGAKRSLGKPLIASLLCASSDFDPLARQDPADCRPVAG